MPLLAWTMLDTFEWLQDLPLATALRESQYMFPVVEGIHLLGIALMVAPAMMFDLRLLGLVWRSEPASRIRNAFLPITVAGFVVMIITGLLLFWAEAAHCYHSKYFWIKVVALALAGTNALVFHRTIDRSISTWDNDPAPPGQARLAGISSLILWTLVIGAGRYTAYNL